MARFYIKGVAAATAVAAILAIGTQAKEPDFTEIPQLDDLREEVLLPHYARITGIHATLPVAAVKADVWLQADMEIVKTRLAELSERAPAGAADPHILEGEMIGATGTYSVNDLGAYAATVIAADTHMVQNWSLATTEFMQMGIEPDHANYLSLHAMAVELDRFEERFQPYIGNPGALSADAISAYTEAATVAQVIFGRLDEARPGQAPSSEMQDEALQAAYQLDTPEM